MDETYVINQVKEDVCYVSCNFNEDMRASQRRDDKNHIVRDYVLPDYTTIRRGHVVQPGQMNQNDYVNICIIVIDFYTCKAPFSSNSY